MRDGRDGRDGKDGSIGKTGPAGKDAYELAITRGLFSGTIEEWFEHQRGVDGEDGASVYELALRNGFVGTEDEFIRQQKGDPGSRGPQGPEGPEGPIGPMPRHEWKGTELRFEMEPNVWGKFVDLKGPAGESKVIAVGGGTIETAVNSWEPSGW